MLLVGYLLFLSLLDLFCSCILDEKNTIKHNIHEQPLQKLNFCDINLFNFLHLSAYKYLKIKF